MAYEDCFFCEEGQGGRLIDEEAVMAEGELPVNLSGGLIGCGHAVGATGIMQTYEVALHLSRGSRRKAEEKRPAGVGSKHRRDPVHLDRLPGSGEGGLKMNEQEKEKWYEDHSKKFGIPVAYLKRAYEKELSGENPWMLPGDSGPNGCCV